LDYTPDDLNKELLKITGLIIDCAKFVEGMDSTIRDQQILAFKADTSVERWDALKKSCSDEEWDKIKKDLVVFVLKRDDKPQEKCELLMKDGLFQHCIDIFPKPLGEPDSGEIDLLYSLYDAIERNQPRYLEPLLQIIARYMRRYFALHEFRALDNILNRLQRRFPSVVVELYDKACDLVLINILRSQYKSFVDDALGELKRRLIEDLNRPQDWDEFLDKFFKKHKGKRNLLQMVELLKEGTFDVDEMKPKKKRKLNDSKSRSKSRERSQSD